MPRSRPGRARCARRPVTSSARGSRPATGRRARRRAPRPRGRRSPRRGPPSRCARRQARARGRRRGTTSPRAGRTSARRACRAGRARPPAAPSRSRSEPNAPVSCSSVGSTARSGTRRPAPRDDDPVLSDDLAAAGRLGRTAVATPPSSRSAPRRGIEQLDLGLDRGLLEVELLFGGLCGRPPLGPLAGDLLRDVPLAGRPPAVPVAGHRRPPFAFVPPPLRRRRRRRRPGGSFASRSSCVGCPSRRPARRPRPPSAARRRHRRRPAPGARSCSIGSQPSTCLPWPTPRRHRPKRRAGSAAAPSRRPRTSTARGRSPPLAGSPMPIRSLATFSVPSSSMTDRRPLCPPCEPLSRNRSLPNGRAKSSVTTSRSASGTRSRASSLRTARPESFM